MTKLPLAEPRMPTDEEHRATSLKWLAGVRPTLIDQWPKELMELSIPTQLVKVDAAVLFSAICDVHDQKGINRDLRGFARELDKLIGWDRKFIRLNSRSPKDGAFPFEVPATISGKEAVSMLISSERVMDDLYEFKWVPEQPAYVALRDFQPRIQGDNEFRCFVKDGDLIAVTHYDYRNEAPAWIRSNEREIRAAIDLYFTEKVKPALPIETVVFDVAMFADKSFTLIEINPYGRSDPCHFGSYEKLECASSFIEMGQAA